MESDGDLGRCVRPKQGGTFWLSVLLHPAFRQTQPWLDLGSYETMTICVSPSAHAAVALTVSSRND